MVQIDMGKPARCIDCPLIPETPEVCGMESQTPTGAVEAGKEKAVTENKLYCDICQKQIYRNHLWYKLRRRMFEYDIFGEKRQLDICEDCYCLIVEMARSKEATS